MKALFIQICIQINTDRGKFVLYTSSSYDDDCILVYYFLFECNLVLEYQ
jgi:hypothetical protein